MRSNSWLQHRQTAKFGVRLRITSHVPKPRVKSPHPGLRNPSMIGILIVAHGTLGESLIHCASHVLGNAADATDADRRHRPRRSAATPAAGASSSVKQLDQGNGVAGSHRSVRRARPANIAAKLLVPGRVEGVAGVELAHAGARADLPQRASAEVVVTARPFQAAVEGVMQMPAANAETCSNWKLRSSTSSACTRVPRPS